MFCLDRHILTCHFDSESDHNHLLQVAGGYIKLALVNDSWMDLEGIIVGPPDTPYEGGKFTLEIKVPETYPFNPPKVNKFQFYAVHLI